MDQRVPGNNAAKAGVGQVERGHRALDEAQPWQCLPGECQHARGQVDAEGVQPELVQVAGDPAGTASDVSNRSQPVP